MLSDAKSNSHLPLSFWSSSQRGGFFSLRAQALQRQTKESQRRKEKGSREDSTDGRWDPKANETSPQNPMRWAMGWWDDGCPVPGPIWGFFTIQFDYVGTLFFLMGWHCRISIDNSSSMGFPSIEMLRYWYIPIHCCWTNVFCKQIMCVCESSWQIRGMFFPYVFSFEAWIVYYRNCWGSKQQLGGTFLILRVLNCFKHHRLWDLIKE